MDCDWKSPVTYAVISSLPFRNDSQIMLPVNPIKYLKKSTKAQSGCRTEKRIAQRDSECRHESVVLWLAQQCRRFPLCSSLPVGRSASEGSSSPLLKPGVISPGGSQSLCCPLCPRARLLKRATWSGVTKIHFRQLFKFPLLFVISANNTCCILSALYNHSNEFHRWMSVHCPILQTGYLKHKEEKGRFHGAARVLMV